MQKQKTQQPELILVGLTARTNNANEMDPATSKIGQLAGMYLGNDFASKIQHRATSGVTYAAYTNYESDMNGDYTYFIGEAVDSLEGQDLETFRTITIPASHYQQFTTPPGSMPGVVIAAWQAIWAMDEIALDGKRTYVADFEIYDERASNPESTIVDIYIGVKD